MTTGDDKLSADTYRAILLGGPEAVTVSDTQGVILEVNEEACRLLGRSRQEMVGESLVDYIAPEALERMPPQFESLESGEPIVIERTLVRPDGTEVNVEIAARVPPGTEVLVGFLRDISPRVSAERRLRRYERMVASSPSLLSMVDRHLRYVVVNDAYLEAHGRSREEIVGRTVVGLLGEEVFWQAVEPRLRRAFVGEVVQYQSWFDFTGHGRRFCTVTYYPSRDEAGDIDAVVVSVEDATALHDANLRLQNSEARLTQALVAANAGAWEWDLVSGEVIWTASNYRLMGFDPDDPRGVEELWHSRLHPEDIEGAMEAIARALERREGLNFEFRTQYDDGEVRWFRSVGKLLFDEAGVPSHMYGIQVDITPQKTSQLEREEAHRQVQALNRELEARVAARTSELAELNRSLEVKVEARTRQLLEEAEERRRLESRLFHAQRMDAIGRLAAGVAHDFNNLLTGVLANATFLTSEVRGARGTMAAEEIVDLAERGATLTSRLLTFGRKEQVEGRLVDVGSNAEGFLPMVQRIIGHKVQVTTDLEQGLYVRVDPGHVEQILLNLAVNARDAMPEGGRLQVQVCAATGPGGAELVKLVVRDDGHGMEPEVLERAREPFFTTKPPGQGTGLGLSTVADIVHRWSGEMTLDSAPGEGTRVTVLLPRSDEVAPPEAAAPPAAPPQSHLEGAVVLLVEDDDTVRVMLERLLDHLGHEVVSFRDPLEALSWLRGGESIDLLLTDVSLPHIDGVELTRRVAPLAPGAGLLFMSGYGQKALEASGWEHVPILSKPFSLEELEVALVEALRAEVQGLGVESGSGSS